MAKKEDNLKKLIKELLQEVKKGTTVSISLDYHWWVKRYCSPWEDRIVKDAILYPDDINSIDIVTALEKAGCNFDMRVPMGFGHVTWKGGSK